LGRFCVGSRSIRLLEVLNARSTLFFAVRFRAHIWVRWIVCGSDCLELCPFYTTYVLICCIPVTGFLCDLLSQVYAPSVLYFLIFLIYFL